jgi:hypothetical protein
MCVIDNTSIVIYASLMMLIVFYEINKLIFLIVYLQVIGLCNFRHGLQTKEDYFK